MADADALDLESAIRQLPGVLGCVILTDPETGRPEEVQTFVRAGTDRGTVHREVLERAAARGVEGHLKQVLVFELQAASHLGDRESLQRAAEMAEQDARARGRSPVAEDLPPQREARPLLERPRFDRVLLTSTTWKSEAEVALGPQGEEVWGQAEGEKTPHNLKVLAQATLDAANRLAHGLDIELKGASLVNSFGREAVLVILELEGSLETLGAALVRDGPVSEAAVRATLDALNRRLAYGG